MKSELLGVICVIQSTIIGIGLLYMANLFGSKPTENDKAMEGVADTLSTDMIGMV